MAFVHLSVCLFFCFYRSEQCNSLTYWWIFFNFSHIVLICLNKSSLHFRDVNDTIAYFKASLTFMGPLPRRRSTLYECNSLVFTDIHPHPNIPFLHPNSDKLGIFKWLYSNFLICCSIFALKVSFFSALKTVSSTGYLIWNNFSILAFLCVISNNCRGYK